MMCQQIPISKIRLGKNSRLTVKTEELAGLMQSIKKEGLLQPIGVKKDKSGYQVAYGNRRFLAMSKLGKNHISAVILDKTLHQTDVDIANLAENVQRRNISPVEVGRYIQILKKDKMSYNEMSVRLGASKKYLKDCFSSFTDVPKEMRSKVAYNIPGKTTKKGELSLTTINKIRSAEKSYSLNHKLVKKLYQHALTEDFNLVQIPKYAAALLEDPKADLPNIVKKQMTLKVNFLLSEKEYYALFNKHVTKGPFRSMRQLIMAILKGQKTVHIRGLK